MTPIREFRPLRPEDDAGMLIRHGLGLPRLENTLLQTLSTDSRISQNVPTPIDKVQESQVGVLSYQYETIETWDHEVYASGIANPKQLVRLTWNVAQILRYISEQYRIHHMDINPNNILLRKPNNGSGLDFTNRGIILIVDWETARPSGEQAINMVTPDYSWYLHKPKQNPQQTQLRPNKALSREQEIMELHTQLRIPQELKDQFENPFLAPLLSNTKASDVYDIYGLLRTMESWLDSSQIEHTEKNKIKTQINQMIAKLSDDTTWQMFIEDFHNAFQSILASRQPGSAR